MLFSHVFLSHLGRAQNLFAYFGEHPSTSYFEDTKDLTRHFLCYATIRVVVKLVKQQNFDGTPYPGLLDKLDCNEL